MHKPFRILLKVQIRDLTYKGIITKTKNNLKPPRLVGFAIFFLQILNVLISLALLLNKINFLSRVEPSFV